MFLDDFTEELDKIQNAQIDARKMTLNPPWKRTYATGIPGGRLTATEVTRRVRNSIYPGQKIEGDIYPFPLPKLPPLLRGIDQDSQWDKWNEYYGSLEEWTWRDATRGFFYKITRRLKMFRKRKERMIKKVVKKEIMFAQNEHYRLIHESQPPRMYHHDGITMPVNDVLRDILNYLEVTYKQIPGTINMVSVKKLKKKAKRKAHKSKKK